MNNAVDTGSAGDIPSYLTNASSSSQPVGMDRQAMDEVLDILIKCGGQTHFFKDAFMNCDLFAPWMSVMLRQTALTSSRNSEHILLFASVGQNPYLVLHDIRNVCVS